MNEKQAIIDTVVRVLSRHKYVVHASLFGSLARGDFTPESDVDLLVEYDENRPKGFDAFSIYGELEEAIGRKVEIVQKHLLHDFVAKNVIEDLEPIYDREEI
jgi:hypothetical protein